LRPIQPHEERLYEVPRKTPFLGTQQHARLQGQQMGLLAAVVSLRAKLEGIRAHEWNHARPRLAGMTASQRDDIETLTRSIIEQVLQLPVTVLSHAEDGERERMLGVFIDLFRIEAPPEPERAEMTGITARAV